MPIGLLAVQTLNGLQLGVLLFLIAAGLTLVFGVMGFVNLAHGVQYMMGAYFAVAAYAWTQNFALSLIVALVGAMLLGLALELAVFRRLYGRDHLDQVLATFGVILFLNEAVRWAFGPAPLSLPIPDVLGGSIRLMPGLLYPVYRLAIIAAGLGIAALLYVLVNHTRAGMLVRAGSTNAPMVAALGVDIGRLFTGVFAFGAMLAGFAGVMVAPILAVEPNMGDNLLILAFVAFAALWPLVHENTFLLTMGTLVALSVIGATSLHLIIRTGHISFAHAGFMGVGAYVCVLLVMKLQLPFAVSLAAGAAAATGAGFGTSTTTGAIGGFTFGLGGGGGGVSSFIGSGGGGGGRKLTSTCFSFFSVTGRDAMNAAPTPIAPTVSAAATNATVKRLRVAERSCCSSKASNTPRDLESCLVAWVAAASRLRHKHAPAVSRAQLQNRGNAPHALLPRERELHFIALALAGERCAERRRGRHHLHTALQLRAAAFGREEVAHRLAVFVFDLDERTHARGLARRDRHHARRGDTGL